MHHFVHQIQQGAPQGSLITVVSHIQPDAVRETSFQQFELLSRMHGPCAIFMLEVIVEYCPKGVDVISLPDTQSRFASLDSPTVTRLDKLYPVVESDSRSHISGHEPRLAATENGVKVFLGRYAVVNPRNSLVDHLFKTLLPEPFIQLSHQGHHTGSGRFPVGQQSAVSQPLV